MRDYLHLCKTRELSTDENKQAVEAIGELDEETLAQIELEYQLHECVIPFDSDNDAATWLDSWRNQMRAIVAAYNRRRKT